MEKKAPMVERKIQGERIFEGKVLTLEKDMIAFPNGQTSLREVIRHKGAVCVIPFDGKTVTLVRQYRYAVEKMLLEIPAGKLDFVGEEPLSAAMRELKEETGYTAGRMIDLGLYLGSPAILDEKIYMFLALDLTEGEAELDADEYLSVVKIPLEEAVELVMKGDIPDGKTAYALLRLNQMRTMGLL